jgi:hypothetical protein
LVCTACPTPALIASFGWLELTDRVECRIELCFGAPLNRCVRTVLGGRRVVVYWDLAQVLADQRFEFVAHAGLQRPTTTPAENGVNLERSLPGCMRDPLIDGFEVSCTARAPAGRVLPALHAVLAYLSGRGLLVAGDYAYLHPSDRSGLGVRTPSPAPRLSGGQVWFHTVTHAMPGCADPRNACCSSLRPGCLSRGGGPLTRGRPDPAVWTGSMRIRPEHVHAS